MDLTSFFWRFWFFVFVWVVFGAPPRQFSVKEEQRQFRAAAEDIHGKLLEIKIFFTLQKILEKLLVL